MRSESTKPPPPRSLQRLHDRFDRFGVEEWVAAPPPCTPEGATCSHNSELSPEGYDLLFAHLKRAAGAGARAGGLTDLGVGCGRGLAHAVASGAFRHGEGREVVPLRVEAARAALRDLHLTRRVAVALGSFNEPGYEVCTPCALSFDVAFDRATLKGLARVLEASPALRAFVSFKPPGRWEDAGLATFEVTHTGRVRSTGEERFTFYVLKREVV